MLDGTAKSVSGAAKNMVEDQKAIVIVIT